MQYSTGCSLLSLLSSNILFALFAQCAWCACMQTRGGGGGGGQEGQMGSSTHYSCIAHFDETVYALPYFGYQDDLAASGLPTPSPGKRRKRPFILNAEMPMQRPKGADLSRHTTGDAWCVTRASP